MARNLLVVDLVGKLSLSKVQRRVVRVRSRILYLAMGPHKSCQWIPTFKINQSRPLN